MVGIIADEAKLFRKKRAKHKTSIGETDDSSDKIVSHLDEFIPNYGKLWIRVPHLVHLNILMFIVSLTATNSGFDGSLLNAFQSMDDWKNAMGKPSGAVLGALNNGTAFFIASYLSDKFGRRHAITIGNIIMICGVVVQSCAGTWLNTVDQAIHNDKRCFAMSLVARIIIGFGAMISGVGDPPLMSELAYPSHRQAVTAFFNSNWYLGAIISGWVSFGTRNMSRNWCWRIPTILQAFFPLIQLFLIYLVPESPRYLISKGQPEKAREIFVKYHAGGNEKLCSGLIDFEMSEIQSAIEQEVIANKSSYMDFFKTPGNRKRLFLACFIGIIMQLSGNGLVSYYLNKVLNSIGVTSTTEQLIFNGGLQIYNYGISIIINLTLFQKGKRRIVFITSIAMMLLFYVIWTILSAINQKRNFEDKSLGKGVMAMIFIVLLVLQFGIEWFTQFASIYNGFVNSIAMDAIEWKYYIVYCCILAVELVVGYFTFVETGGLTLEEVAEVFGESIGDVDYNYIKEKNAITTGHIEEASPHEDSASTEKKCKSGLNQS
ncbi:unnamed protein product [Wickerhamomyces anomalus]